MSRIWIAPLLVLLASVPPSLAVDGGKQVDPAARSAAYVGTWMPDAAANAALAKQTRHRVPPEGRGVGAAKGGAGSPDGPRLKRMAQGKDGPVPGLMHREMDFAAPLHGHLVIAAARNGVAFGKKGEPLITLPFSGAIQLADGKSLAFTDWEGDALVIEINADEGVRITHRYSLEAKGTRLRLRTHIAGGPVPMPGGIDLERVFKRVSNSA